MSPADPRRPGLRDLEILTTFVLAEGPPEFSNADAVRAEAGRIAWRRYRDEAIEAIDRLEVRMRALEEGTDLLLSAFHAADMAMRQSSSLEAAAEWGFRRTEYMRWKNRQGARAPWVRRERDHARRRLPTLPPV